MVDSRSGDDACGGGGAAVNVSRGEQRWWRSRRHSRCPRRGEMVEHVFFFFFGLGLAGLSDENRSDFTLKNGRPGWNKYYWMAEISWLL